MRRLIGGRRRAGASPFAGRQLYVQPDTSAHRQAEAWRDQRPDDAALMGWLAAQPTAAWFGDWRHDVNAEVARHVAAAAAADALPVLVAYAIPHRDLGGYSAGGVTSATDYRAWITGFAAGISDAPAVVILEPDALAACEQMPWRQRRERRALLREALGVVCAQPGASVYLDAGHSGWMPPERAAEALEGVGVSIARGFALNVSNFRWTATERAYGQAIGTALGRPTPFVIDTSRNGAGPAPNDEACNPPGRALGTPPTTATGEADVDAYLWVKPPGESDGPCHGGPPAGRWWPRYALELARSA